MIQRIQTIFILLAVVLTILTMFCQLVSTDMMSMGSDTVFYCLYSQDVSGHTDYNGFVPFMFLVMTTATSIFNIFLFNRRRLQKRLCMICIFMLFAWYAVEGYIIYSEAIDSSLTLTDLSFSLPVTFPLISIILMILAIKGITADENLVRSYDRFR